MALRNNDGHQLKARFNKKPRLSGGVVLENILFYFDKVFSDICYTYDGLVSTVYPGILCMPGFFMHCSQVLHSGNHLHC